MTDRELGTNVFDDVLHRLHAIVAELASGRVEAGLDLSRIVVEPPREAEHGDLATNAAMVLAKDLRCKPRDLAEAIAAKLGEDSTFASVSIAGPGFINLTLHHDTWRNALRHAIGKGSDFGRSQAGQGTRVNVEYVSANPTGPMHVGHCRGAVFGDALASLLAFAGYDVTREYYINDAGAQVDVLARSAFLRYREALGESIGAMPEGLYPGEYLIPVGQALAADYGISLKDRPESEWLPPVRAKAVAMMMDIIREDLAALGIAHEVFFSERSLHDAEAGGTSKIAQTIAFLEREGLLYRGTLPPPKGKQMEDWEPRELLLFRTTQFGDEVDRPIMKSDGTPAYFTPDIAYHLDKFERGFREMILVLGADHSGYLKRLHAAVQAVSRGEAVLDVKICQLVRFLRGGEPVKMSKRAGELVTVRQVVDEVGPDAVRFMMLFRKNDAVLDFDFQKVVEQSRDNPVFYVQYAHARCHSAFRNARESLRALPESWAEQSKFFATASLSPLTDPGELALIRRVAQFPRAVEAAAKAHEPHRVAYYLFELASEFHGHWTAGRDSPHLRFIILDDPQITMARLALVHGVATVLAAGLKMLGVGAPEEMR